MSHGINTFFSDLDVGMCEESVKIDSERRIDYKRICCWELSSALAGDNRNVWFPQWLYPYKVLTHSPITRYILENRDAMISAQRQKLYACLSDRASSLLESAIRIYPTHTKQLAYCTLWYSILANYSEGCPYQDAHRPAGRLHDLLISIRNQTADVNYADEVLRNYKSKAESNNKFFLETVDKDVLLTFRELVQNEYERRLLDGQDTTG